MMLAQHFITKPVFEALFENFDFIKRNPVSIALDNIIELLESNNLQSETESLTRFYDEMKRSVSGITSQEGRQKIILELYDNFFSKAFPGLTKELGIVYTPIPVVDFIVHSVNDILISEFGKTFSDPNIHVVDPFTGTGTFITRLIQSQLIENKDIERKFQKEIHANEIVLLAYYIAAVNIETVYHTNTKKEYTPFSGICLTDTFESGNTKDFDSLFMKQNQKRTSEQNKLDIHVIIGNPPYNVGKTGVEYEYLKKRIAETYVDNTSANLSSSVYDSYLYALRWASDRIGDSGVIGFITNGGWIENISMAGVRKSLMNEFNSIYILNLRGDINKNIASSGLAQEGENIFGQSSKTNASIIILVKNPASKQFGQIKYTDIGDKLGLGEKLDKIKNLGSVNTPVMKEHWQVIKPNEAHDWINIRESSFDNHLLIANKKSKLGDVLFSIQSHGVKTAAEQVMCNPSPSKLQQIGLEMVNEYNSELSRYESEEISVPFENFVNKNSGKVNWHEKIRRKAQNSEKAAHSDNFVTVCQVKPFTKSMIYYNKHFVQRDGQMSRMFPKSASYNRTIAISGVGSYMFSALMLDTLPCIHVLLNDQNFPLKVYSTAETSDDKTTQSSLITDNIESSSGITDYGLNLFRDEFKNPEITKEDIFYYTYGLFHSDEYISQFKSNLTKQLPRIPIVKSEENFKLISTIGKELGEIHTNYENAELFPVTFDKGNINVPENHDPKTYFRVIKMKFAKSSRIIDRSKIIYNENISISGIPLDAYNYVVNCKSAIDWVIDRQVRTKENKFGIASDANDFANEVVKDPAYPLKLLLRIITVSIETQKLTNKLPNLHI